MVELQRLAPSPRVELCAKLEGANPTGSVKDRMARVDAGEDALATGALQPGQTILEPSSGNTGISLAMVGARMGHPVRIVMPDNTTPEREQLLRLYGAEIVFSPGAEGCNGAIRLAQELVAADPIALHAVPVRERGQPAGPRGGNRAGDPGRRAGARRVRGRPRHRRDADRGRALPKAARAPSARVIAAEPLPGEQVQGLRSLEEGFVPPVLDASVLDDRCLVSNRDALIGVRRLMREEGIFAGLSSGAVLHVALRVAAEMDEGSDRHAAGRRRVEVPLDRPVGP